MMSTAILRWDYSEDIQFALFEGTFGGDFSIMKINLRDVLIWCGVGMKHENKSK